MTFDEERWAEALAIFRMHGIRAREFVAGRLVDLGMSGDLDGVARWREIGSRLDQLDDAKQNMRA